jgi:hypothetical protein
MIGLWMSNLLQFVLLVDLLERRFPDQLQDIFITLSYNSILYYSKCQIWMTQWYRHILPTSPKKQINVNDLSFQDRYKRSFISNYMYIDKEDPMPEVYDIEMYTDIATQPHLKYLYYRETRTVSNPMPELSNIQFMLMEFIVNNDNIFRIQLKTDEYNYYTVGNRFGRLFCVFYVNHHLNAKLVVTPSDQLAIRLIDHEVNSVLVDVSENQHHDTCIELKKDGYTLLGSL